MSTCIDCKWWVRINVAPGKPVTNPDRPLPGQCRKHAPGIDLSRPNPRTVWPLTRESDFCGKWRSVNGPEPKDGAAEDVEGSAP